MTDVASSGELQRLMNKSRPHEQSRVQPRWLTVALTCYGIVAAALLFTGGPPTQTGTQVNLIPLETITAALAHQRTPQMELLVVNLVLLAPLGVALALGRWRGRHVVVVAVITSCSVTIETLQFLIPGSRSTDIDDVLLNTLGGVIAYAVTLSICRCVARRTAAPAK